MKFEHSHEEDAQMEVRGRAAAQKALRQLCRTSDDDIRPETPALFAELIKELKSLNYDNLNELYEVVRSGRLCDKAK